MSFKETYGKIIESDVFLEFSKKNPNAELCAGFFIIDFFGNDNKKSLDYSVGEKIFTFSLEDNGKIKMSEDKMVEIEGKDLPKLDPVNPDIKIDLEEVKSKAQIKALDEKISSKFNKIIAVLHNKEGKQTWSLTCMLENLIILHVIIDADSGNMDKFERKSMMDLIRKK